MSSPNLECRMREARHPKPNSIVMVKKNGESEIGTSVTLLEYNNIEALLCPSDTTTSNNPSRRRHSHSLSIASLFKCQYVPPAFMAESLDAAYVVRCSDKGGIHLSKKGMTENDTNRCKKRYYKSKLVHYIMCQVAENLSMDLEDVYITVGWPLHRQYSHAFDAFKLIVNRPDSILDPILSKATKDGPDGRVVMTVKPTVTKDQLKKVLVKNIRNLIEIIRAFHEISHLDPMAFSFEDLD